MDVLNVLKEINGKILDGTHCGLLAAVYRAQSETIAELKANRDLFTEKLAQCEIDKQELQELVESRDPEPPHFLPEWLELNPSTDAIRILANFSTCDRSRLTEADMRRDLPLSTVDLNVAVSELQRWGLLKETWDI